LAKPVDRLIGIVARLRAPKGCPWDRKQTHVSLIKFLREEARELEDALRRGHWHEIEDELGDLLLQVLLHSQIAKEKGLFDIQDVAQSQYLKLVRRHPHVFGRRKLRTAAEVLDSWAEIKRKERSQRRRDVRRRRPAQ
jgi:tetrapyrrole methylase family protein/MazG family protein